MENKPEKGSLQPDANALQNHGGAIAAAVISTLLSDFHGIQQHQPTACKPLTSGLSPPRFVLKHRTCSEVLRACIAWRFSSVSLGSNGEVHVLN
jgi:hypothetical protein